MKLLLLIPAALIAFYLFSFTFMAIDSKKVKGIGLEDGRLRSCPGTPNCVLSEEKDKPSYIEPFVFAGNAADEWARMKDAVQKIGGKIIKDDGNYYLWATFKSSFWGFIDDVELRMDAATKTIQVRSASRVGKGDLNVNRKRIERLRAVFNAQPRAI